MVIAYNLHYFFIRIIAICEIRNEFIILKYQSDIEFEMKYFKELALKLLKYSIPFMVAALSLPILNILVRGDIYRDYGYDAIGLFSIYMSFIGILIYIPESFQGYIFPRFAKSADTQSKENIKFKKTIHSIFFIFSFHMCIFFID